MSGQASPLSGRGGTSPGPIRRILARDAAGAEQATGGHIEFVRVHLNDLGPRPALRH